MKFEEYRIADEIKEQLAKMDFRRPTDIQYKAIPSIMKGEDVLAIAQTGTGKTAAFAIPVIDRIHKLKMNLSRKDGIKCIIMVPTHELALQLTEVFNEIGKLTRVVTYPVIGGVDQDPQIKKLEKGIDIMIATPGRMFDLISQGYIRTHRVDTLILDEADHMLDLGFIKDIRDLIYKIPKKRQTLFFSATIDENIKKLAYSLVHKPVRIQISPKNPVARNVDHFVMYVEMDDKRFFLERVIRENPESKILVFVRTRVRSERVTKQMARVDISCLTINGEMDQKERIKALDKFRKGEEKILIATDVSARGIDVDSVDFVINYDLPDKEENYVHRIGRTGRAKKRGNAYSFCSTEEKEMLRKIEAYLTDPIKVIGISKEGIKETIEIQHETKNDWRALMGEIEEYEERSRKRKKRKK